MSAVTREEQGTVGGRPPLQHEGDEEKQSSRSPLGRIKTTASECVLLHCYLCEDQYCRSQDFIVKSEIFCGTDDILGKKGASTIFKDWKYLKHEDIF